MENEIVWQNKDVTSKLLAERLKEKSFSVYGIDVPKIVQVLPTNLPEIWANELKIDNLFLLEDGTLAIVDYESTYSEENKVKYIQYVARVLERYRSEGRLKVKMRMIVIYTADVTPHEVSDIYDVGALRLEVQSAFLMGIDPEETMHRLQEKVVAGEKLTEEEIMQFIILPLTYKGNARKRDAVRETIKLARQIKGEVQTFVLTGISVFADKFMDESMKDEIGGLLKMTLVDEYYWERQEKAVADATAKTMKLVVKEKLAEGFTKESIINKLCRFYKVSRDQAEEYYEQAIHDNESGS